MIVFDILIPIPKFPFPIQEDNPYWATPLKVHAPPVEDSGK